MPRIRLLRVVIAALLVTLVTRLWFLQVVTGSDYVRAAAENRIRTVSVPATRGQILDSAGIALVTNQTRPVVTVDHVAIAGQPDGGRAVLARLAQVLRQPYQTLVGKTRLCGREVAQPCWPGSPYAPIPVTDEISVPIALQITEHQQDFPGVTVELRPVRHYPLGTAAAHVLGYLRAEAGGDGLEAVYDRDLAGRPGAREVSVDRSGTVTGLVTQAEPETGNTLMTSIDSRIQLIAERSLARAVSRWDGDAGAAVVLESATGRVIALASAPTYDPGVWTGGISERDYLALLGPSRPLVSRAIQGEWAPGSTWKVVSTAAAARAGYPLSAGYDCPSSYTVGNRAFANFARADLGRLTMHDALVRSCDTIFYRLADEMWKKDGGLRPVAEPADTLERTADGFGFGVATGIDLPGERAGAVPDRESKAETWKRTRDASCRRAKTGYPDLADRARAAYLKALAAENCRWGATWWAGDAANFAIGQGGVLVTPLQLARAYAALANGGTIFSPRIGRQVLSPRGDRVRTITPPVVGSLPGSPATLAFIRQALTDVPKRGTASAAFEGFPLDRVAVAGKTGTAEVYGKRDTSWFASFAPDPGYTVVVVISQGGRGAQAATPTAREIWDGILALKEVR